MPAATLPDGTIHYREEGDPGAPAVVFVHGVLVDGRLWDGVASRLAAAGLRAIVPDWPLGAHTHPMDPSADMSPRGLARTIAAFLEHLDLTDACLVGNDTGGALVQFTLDADASRVGRVVFTNCDTFDRFPPPPFRAMFRAGRLPGALPVFFQLGRIGPFARLGYSPLVARPIPRDVVAAWSGAGARDAGVRSDLRRLLRSIDPAELVEVAGRLDRFRGDVLVAWAPDDPYFRLADGRRLADAFTSAASVRVVEIPDSRTFVPLDQPGRLADEIAAFVTAGV